MVVATHSITLDIIRLIDGNGLISLLDLLVMLCGVALKLCIACDIPPPKPVFRTTPAPATGAA